MRLFGIIAIVVLAIAAAIIEDVNSTYEELQALQEASRQMDASSYRGVSSQTEVSLSLDVENEGTINRWADEIRESAAAGSLIKGESAAERYRTRREEFFRSLGAECRIRCGGRSCEIEVRRPGHYTIYAQGRNGEATSRIVWDFLGIAWR